MPWCVGRCAAHHAHVLLLPLSVPHRLAANIAGRTHHLQLAPCIEPSRPLGGRRSFHRLRPSGARTRALVPEQQPCLLLLLLLLLLPVVLYRLLL
jgi:hypothetical protein